MYHTGPLTLRSARVLGAISVKRALLCVRVYTSYPVVAPPLTTQRPMRPGTVLVALYNAETASTATSVQPRPLTKLQISFKLFS
jgi:hypothetical protein